MECFLQSQLHIYVDANSGLFSLEAAETNMYDMYVCMIIYFHLWRFIATVFKLNSKSWINKN